LASQQALQSSERDGCGGDRAEAAVIENAQAEIRRALHARFKHRFKFRRGGTLRIEGKLPQNAGRFGIYDCAIGGPGPLQVGNRLMDWSRTMSGINGVGGRIKGLIEALPDVVGADRA
jgi:hypothetical protein